VDEGLARASRSVADYLAWSELRHSIEMERSALTP
jgi:hypothetical protein